MDSITLHLFGNFLPTNEALRLGAVCKLWLQAAIQEHRETDGKWAQLVEIQKRCWPRRLMHVSNDILAAEVLGLRTLNSTFRRNRYKPPKDASNSLLWINQLIRPSEFVKSLLAASDTTGLDYSETLYPEPKTFVVFFFQIKELGCAIERGKPGFSAIRVAYGQFSSTVLPQSGSHMRRKGVMIPELLLTLYTYGTDINVYCERIHKKKQKTSDGIQYVNQILMAIQLIVATLDECRFRNIDGARNKSNWNTLVELSGWKHAVLFVLLVLANT